MKKYSNLFASCVLLILISPILAFAQTDPNSGVEATVRASMIDMPGMADIAKCESGFRQFVADGSVLKGGTGKNYIGIFQISNGHRSSAESMAFNIDTVEGNIAYARHMYFARGTAPWVSCLGSNPVVGAPEVVIQPNPTPTPTPTPIASTATGTITTNLSFGMVHTEVMYLQKLLNQLGFTVSLSGPGSAGNETSMFGQLTREAVRKYQCAKAIVCEGSESVNGYGRVGPRTRASLNQP